MAAPGTTVSVWATPRTSSGWNCPLEATSSRFTLSRRGPAAPPCNLLDGNRNVVQAATVNGTKNHLIQRLIPGGTYFIRITEAGSQPLKGTGYHLYVRNEQP